MIGFWVVSQLIGFTTYDHQQMATKTTTSERQGPHIHNNDNNHDHRRHGHRHCHRHGHRHQHRHRHHWYYHFCYFGNDLRNSRHHDIHT